MKLVSFLFHGLACKRAGVCILALALSGCGFFGSKPTEQPVQEQESKQANASIAQESVIAQDFINLMMQIDTLSPSTTALNFSLNPGDFSGDNQDLNRRQERFGRALRLVAARNGYALNAVNDANAPNAVRYSISNTIVTEEPLAYTYDLSIGDVDFRRSYLSPGGSVVEPYKEMLVRGTDVSQLEPDDSIFNVSSQSANAELDQSSSSQLSDSTQQSGFDSPLQVENTPMLAEQPVAQSSELADVQIAQSEPLAAESSPAIVEEPVAPQATVSAQVPSSSSFSQVRKANVADTGASNYENLLVGKEDVAEQVLIFGDDSYVLGARNKQLLGDIMSDFNPETDVISVVGCSTGVTKIENGNAALAIGRANRVKEALLYSGIPHDKIYDEGCWSPTANSTPFPNRGVVITVKRNEGNG